MWPLGAEGEAGNEERPCLYEGAPKTELEALFLEALHWLDKLICIALGVQAKMPKEQPVLFLGTSAAWHQAVRRGKAHQGRQHGDR